MAVCRLALCQMRVTDGLEQNLFAAERMVARAVQNGADIAVLPEMFCCPYNNASFVEHAQRPHGHSGKEPSVYEALSHMARNNRIPLIGGSMPELDEEGHIYNTCFIFDAEGHEKAFHRKMHLFDIDVPGGQYFKESDTFTRGDGITVVTLGGVRVGVAICFDIRFPELARAMAQQGAEVLVYPAAFNMTTGPAHWELTIRTRALDDQLFVAACSPARDTSAGYVAYGNSIVADPWGSVAARLDETEDILFAELELDRVRSVRRQLPLVSSLRGDMYPVAGGTETTYRP